VSANLPAPWRMKTAFLAALLTVLLTLGGCFLFRAKPDARAQELMSRLSLGLTAEEVLSRLGPPQRRGLNLFDKKKEYWIYEFAIAKRGKRTRDADRDEEKNAPASELQLRFEQGKLAAWDHVPRN